MKIDTRRYFQILEEEVKKYEAPKSELLGNFAFAPQRIENGEKNIPPEENTEYENRLLQALQLHLGMSNEPMMPDFTNTIKKYINLGFYKKVFRPVPAGTEIFRGQSVSSRTLRKWLGIGPEEKIPAFSGSADVNFTWKQWRGKDYASSWTIDKSVAVQYSRRDYENRIGTKTRPWQIVMTAAPGQEKNFLNSIKDSDNPDSGLYRFVRGFEGENEVIALGPINVSKITWNIEPHHKKYVVNDLKLNIKQKFLTKMGIDTEEWDHTPKIP